MPLTETHEKIEKTKRWRSTFDILRDVIFANRIFLTPHEEQVILFIYQRTAMFGKEWEAIPIRHFVQGVWSQKNGLICSRLTIKTNSVIAALRHLRGKGLIEARDHATKAHLYRIVRPNEIALHDIILYLRAQQPKLLKSVLLQLHRNRARLPPAYLNVLQAGENSQPRNTAIIPTDSDAVAMQIHHASPQRIKPILNTPKNQGRIISNVGAQPAEVKAVKGLTSRSRLRILPKPGSKLSAPSKTELALLDALAWQKLHRGSRTHVSLLKVWENAWCDAVKKHYGLEVPGLSSSQFGRLKQEMEEYGLPIPDAAEFIEWAVRNWEQLRRMAFSYSRDRPYGPPAPDLHLLVSRIVPAYGLYRRR